MTKPTIWTGCYNNGWQGVLTPEAFSHPAKVSRGLAKRIYQHALERGWLKEGDVVLDPFGGIAGFAFHALQHGLTWIGIELEQKFVDLGQQNIALWNARYSRMPRWGTALLLQGDSRRLSEVVREAGVCISSPPYANAINQCGEGPGGRSTVWVASNSPGHDMDKTERLKSDGIGYGTHPAQLGNMREGDFDCAISSPPYSSKTVHDDNSSAARNQRKGAPPNKWGQMRDGSMTQAGYGTHPAQLGNMREGDFDCAISSPPYAKYGTGHDGAHPRLDAAEDERRERDGCRRRPAYGTETGQLGNMREGDVDAVVSSPPYADAKAHPSIGSVNKDDWGSDGRDIAGRRNLSADYGNTEGQLAAMPTGEHRSEPGTLPVDACISSPPWEQAQTGGGISATMRGEGNYKLTTSLPGNLYQPSEHGTSEGQLGQESTTTFWQAAKTIVQQVYQVLKPGGYAIWVVKAFVRNKAIVDFPGQWQRVAEACGFETVEIIHALLTEDRGAQYGLDGELHKKTIKRAGFFRRLHERKYPHLAIDFEIVLCQQKPLE